MHTQSTVATPSAPCGRIAEASRRSLDAAMADLAQTISFFANRGVAMDDMLVKKLVELRDRYQSGLWQTADEQTFWPAYRTFVAGTGRPVDGLIVSRTWTRWIAGIAAAISLLVLFLLVTQLSYWAGLDATIRQIDTLERAVAEKRAKLMTLQVRREDAASDETADSVGAERKVLDFEIAQACLPLASLHKILAERVADSRMFLISQDFPATAVPKTTEACLKDAEQSRAVQGYVMGNAQILRTARQDYVLPVLFGLLGTIAYILRSLSKDVRDGRLTINGIVGAGVRIPLGMLAGLAVGWIVKPDGGLVQITPWALAFVAGYGVELVFTAMDRLIAAFSGERAPTGGTATS